MIGCKGSRSWTNAEGNYESWWWICLLFAALCNEDANGNVPLGKSCNRYWNCQGGYPRLQRCPAMLVFDKHSLRCVVPPTEDCDILPPTVQQEDQQEGQAERGQVRIQLLVSIWTKAFINFISLSSRIMISRKHKQPSHNNPNSQRRM